MKLNERTIINFESKLDDKLSSKNNSKMFAGFKKNKVVNEVLDQSTVMAMYKLINSHVITYVNGVVSAGKESVIFWAVSNDVNIALKTYLTSTSNFKKRISYISGDPRFTNIKKNTKNIVYLWAKKEFKNLSRCTSLGINVPKPIHVIKNILVMEFIGTNGRPAKTLLQSNVDEEDYYSVIEILKNLYQKAKLVHADLSEYNVFKIDDKLVLFDLGSAVDIKHPNSLSLLQRDINNISTFFVKRGLNVINPSDILKEVVV